MQKAWYLLLIYLTKNVVEKSKIACENGNISTFDRFAKNGKTVSMHSGTKSRIIEDYYIYCYLLIQNANPIYKRIML